MNQEQNEVEQQVDVEAVKARLLKEALRDEPELDPDLFGASIEDVLKVVANEKVTEWNQLMEDYPPQKGKLYLFFPASKNSEWRRGETGAPSFKNLYRAMDRHQVGHSLKVCVVSVPLGIVPDDYFPIRPTTGCPGIERWWTEKNGLGWEWRVYRDVINLLARQVAQFIHNQKVKRRHMVIVRKNSIEHDIWRTVQSLLGYPLDIRPCAYPLWSEEAVEVIDELVRELAEDIEYLDL